VLNYFDLGLMPHGTCFFWNVPLTALHAVSDSLIAIAYLSIPVTLYTHRERATPKVRPIVLLFTLFIFSCGVGHLLAAWNIWHSAYWLEGFEKVFTASISICTALYLYQQIPELLDTQKTLEKTQEALEETVELSLTDPLTGLLNRRGFDQAIRTAMFQRKNEQLWHTLLLLDLDHFKAINDTSGHEVGDRILSQVAQGLQKHTRLLDITARLGGDEFAVFLPGCHQAQAQIIAETLRQAIFELNQQNPDLAQAGVTLSVSIGLVASNQPHEAQDLSSRADKALYHSKRNGKNRISWDDSPKQFERSV